MENKRFEDWKFIKYTKRYSNSDIKKTMKIIVNQIKDVLESIATKGYDIFEKMILNARITDLRDVSFIYREKFIIARSIQRIFDIGDNYEHLNLIENNKQLKSFYQEKLKFTDKYLKKLKLPKEINRDNILQKIIIVEYACIYNDIYETGKSEVKFSSSFLALQMSMDHYLLDPNTIGKLEKVFQTYYDIIPFSFLNNIYIPDEKECTFILASPKGISASIRCTKNPSYLYLDGMYQNISINELSFGYISIEQTQSSNPSSFKIDRIEDINYILNTASAELFISLLHFYSKFNKCKAFYKYRKLLMTNITSKLSPKTCLLFKK